MFGGHGCLLWQNVDIHSIFMLDAALCGYMNRHCEEPECSFHTLEGRSQIGYYAALFNVNTCTFYQYEQSQPPCISLGSVDVTTGIISNKIQEATLPCLCVWRWPHIKQDSRSHITISVGVTMGLYQTRFTKPHYHICGCDDGLISNKIQEATLPCLEAECLVLLPSSELMDRLSEFFWPTAGNSCWLSDLWPAALPAPRLWPRPLPRPSRYAGRESILHSCVWTQQLWIESKINTLTSM